ncbi:MAG TPA: TIGR02757 family protein [Bacteroidales bacterium]|nr:TIGR02757 family protein [Bacteroidales bacterium]HPB25824.1 TIGR02757 family protein [Bacteroidales bacterium]HPI30582.1 TIGR02757 family protein [Bacteroidales bacterium]HQN16456.1 TIGR02757 family protein [Bacteroidales bacterium]HQP16131.1 TIGR02757 family protein [Bacteroidales bacterium]
MNTSELRELLDEKYDEYCTPAFIDDDPISVPHYFSKKEDIEIAGFFAAMLAWGQRQQIIKSARNLMQMMDYAPFDFLTGATKKELNPFKSFVYRTFNGNDCVFFLHSLKNIYLKHQGLEAVFIEGYRRYGDLFAAIGMFRTVFFETAHLPRSEKHISDPARNSACKRLHLFLRWMVRSNNRGVDFGLWKEIPASKLYCPLDLHTGNVSRALGLLNIKENNKKAVEELTGSLRCFDPEDPVKYDFSLFGLGFYNKICNFDV